MTVPAFDSTWPQPQDPRLSVRPAALPEEAVVLELLNDSCAWLRATGKGNNAGVDQWPGEYELWEIQEEWDAAEFYLAFYDGRPAATFRFTSTPDWYGQFGSNHTLCRDIAARMGVSETDLRESIREVGLDQLAMYWHTFAVKRELAGQGLGYKLLAWGEDATRHLGFPYLRLDCHHVNHRLRQYYVDAGFQSLHTIAENPFGGIFHKRVQP